MSPDNIDRMILITACFKVGIVFLAGYIFAGIWKRICEVMKND